MPATVIGHPSIAASLIASAVLAPSSHNTQPWRFKVHGDLVELFADRTRALPVNDPQDRELVISCGAALFNLRVAAAAAGLRARIALLPEAADDDLLARVQLERASGREALAALQPSLVERRTWRKRFAERPVDDTAVQALRAAAAAEGAQLLVLEDSEARHALAALVAEGDALQWADPHWRRELSAWMHPHRRGDGLPLPALALPLAQAVVRTFDMGQGVGAKDRELADASPLLAVLATPGDTLAHWLAAGQGLQHLLLAGVQMRLQASYLNQPVQVASLRPRLAALIGDAAVPQLVLRLGHVEGKLPASARRPLADVTLVD